MTKVKGTIGYSEIVQKYINATNEIPFEILHRDFIKFIPTMPSLILDIGAGIGRDANELSKRGHTVIAVEPLSEFRIAGKKLYQSANLKWIDDALPRLKRLVEYKNKIDFILSSGVWHHLDEQEQNLALANISQLLKPNGIFAFSLRNGPAGVGTHIFPTNLQMTIKDAKEYGFDLLLELDNQPSLMKNKEKVKWSRLVLKKRNRN